MIRILMLTTSSSLMDGINRHILTLASALNSQSDFEVAICTVMPYGEFHLALEKNGVKAFALGYSNGHKWGILSKYRKVLNEFHPDIIHIHVMAIMERIVSATLYRHIKYVVTIHGIADKLDHIPFKMRIETFLNKIFTIPLSARFYISNGVRNILKNSLPPVLLSEVCYNPIHFGIVPVRQYKLHNLIKVDSSTLLIGTSCRISYVKNPQSFTKVMCKVLQNMSSVHAVVMGDGSEALKKECQSIVNETGVEKRFHWMGYCHNASELVHDLNCFIMTSRCEGLPTALLESMAVKTPIAMMKGEGGLLDLVEIDEVGDPIAAIAEKDDIDGLANKIIELLKNPDKAQKQAERAYEVGKQFFDIDIVSEQMCNIYKRILQ